MATQDWPTDRAFMGATFTLGADVPKSVFRGFYTGNRETLSHLADRLTCIVTLPPCRSKADAARREAFCMGLVSTGDWVRFPMPQRAAPVGAIGGSPTVSGAVLAGARSLTLTNFLSLPNRLPFPSAIDNAAWTKTTGVTVTANYASAPAGLPGMAERVQYSGAGSAGSFRVYEAAAGDLSVPAAGQQVVCSVYLTAPTGTPTVRIANNLGNFTTCALNANWQRFSVAGTGNGSTALQLLLYSNTADNAAWDISMYGAQAETGATATALAIGSISAGDFFGVGGNLLQVAYPGATGNDTMTVPLLYPAPKAISSGAAVTLTAPTGTWELDTDGLQLDYTAGVIQQGIALPFRQVAV